MGRKGKFKPLLVPRAARAAIKDEFFSCLTSQIAAWRNGELSGVDLVGIYWLEFMKLWRPKDYKSGKYYRSCPERAHAGYEIWKADPSRIILTEQIPQADELLEWQCEGRRVVTLVTDPEKFLEEINGRDPLSFLLHDLIHAYEFFADPVRMNEQIEFYRRLKAEMSTDAALRARLSQDGAFAEKFDYLIADMNSHPAHLEAYYKHISQVP